MSNAPKQNNFWKQPQSSANESRRNEKQENNDYSETNSNVITSGWPTFDCGEYISTFNQPPSSSFADLSSPWPASDRLWSSSGIPNNDWSSSSNHTWQNGYSEGDANAHALLPYIVPPSLTQDKVFHQIWSLNSKQSNVSPNPWDGNQQNLVVPKEILADSTEPINNNFNQSLEDANKPQITQEKHESLPTEAKAVQNRSANATANSVSELINDPQHWGKLPINQSVPWKTTLEDGNLHTARASNSNLLNYPQHLESNVWTNELSTGTGIWELHYEQVPTRPSNWPMQDQETPIAANDSGNGSLHASAFHQPQQPAFPASLTQADHESSIWGSTITGTFQTRPFASSSHFGPPGGSLRRPIFGAGVPNSTANRLSEDPTDLGSSPRATWNPISSHVLNQENGWSTLTGRWAAPIAASGHIPSSVAPSFCVPGGGSEFEDASQHSDINNVPMAAYKSNLVRYFLQQGFRRDDIESVLAECNMDIDRSLAVLRLRSRNAATTATNNPNAAGSNGGPPRQSGGFGGPRRAPNAPIVTAIGQFGQFATLQPASAVPVSTAASAFGRGITRPLGVNASNRLIAGGVNNTRMSGVGPCASGDSILGSSLSSLLGLPPAQQNENGFSPMLMRGRNYQCLSTNPPSTNFALISSIVELQRKRQDIQRQIHLFRSNPSMCSQPGGMSLLNELSIQLHQIENQINTREVYACNPVSSPQPPISTLWSNPEETRFGTASLQFGSGSCNGNINNAASSVCNNPLSRATSNGFRSPRHNSGMDNFATNGGNSSSLWLYIRGVPPSMPRTALESFLGVGLLSLHPLPTRGTFVARFVNSEAAVDVVLHLTSNAANSSPLLVNLIEERQAFDLLMEALSITSNSAAASCGGSAN